MPPASSTQWSINKPSFQPIDSRRLPSLTPPPHSPALAASTAVFLTNALAHHSNSPGLGEECNVTYNFYVILSPLTLTQKKHVKTTRLVTSLYQKSVQKENWITRFSNAFSKQSSYPFYPASTPPPKKKKKNSLPCYPRGTEARRPAPNVPRRPIDLQVLPGTFLSTRRGRPQPKERLTSTAKCTKSLYKIKKVKHLQGVCMT